ncbi:MAG: RNA polymerase sigma factor [Verrucomicrobia bacterium]|nr:RNA polymerase sigma factor [Verrucomicrobiota bacterium]
MDALPLSRITAAQAGDAQAAGELVEEHHARIFAFLRRLCGQDADAEDLTQRTFARVWTSIGSYAGHSSVSSWIHGIARHVYLDWRRTRRPGESPPDAWWEACASPDPGPADQAASADLSRVVYAAVDALPEELRTVIHLHHYQGLTLQETAEALEVSASTVKNRLRGALEELQAALVHRPDRRTRLPTSRPS